MKYRIVAKTNANGFTWYYGQYHKGHWWNKWRPFLVQPPCEAPLYPMMETSYEECKNHIKSIIEKEAHEKNSNIIIHTEIYEDIF
jgi:hypothetical protein